MSWPPPQLLVTDLEGEKLPVTVLENDGCFKTLLSVQSKNTNAIFSLEEMDGYLVYGRALRLINTSPEIFCDSKIEVVIRAFEKDKKEDDLESTMNPVVPFFANFPLPHIKPDMICISDSTHRYFVMEFFPGYGMFSSGERLDPYQSLDLLAETESSTQTTLSPEKDTDSSENGYKDSCYLFNSGVNLGEIYQVVEEELNTYQSLSYEFFAEERSWKGNFHSLEFPQESYSFEIKISVRDSTSYSINCHHHSSFVKVYFAICNHFSLNDVVLPPIFGLEGNKIVSECITLNPPALANGLILDAVGIGKCVKSENGKIYSIGEKKRNTSYGSVYQGKEVVFVEGSSLFKFKTDNFMECQFSITAVNLDDYMAGRDEALMKELTALQYIKQFPRHPNIANLVEVITDNEFVYIIAEYEGEEKLVSALNYVKEAFDEGKQSIEYFQAVEHTLNTREIFLQVLDAMTYLHSIGICHRDISAENIVIHSSTGLVKLISFGEAVCIPRIQFGCIENVLKSYEVAQEQINPYLLTYPDATPHSLIPLFIRCPESVRGKPPYTPPEMYRKFSYNAYAADIWNLGIVFYFLLTGSTPRFGGDPPLYDSILMDTLSASKLSSHEKDLLRRMLISANPSERPTIQDIKNHAWTIDIRKTVDSEKHSKELRDVKDDEKS